MTITGLRKVFSFFIRPRRRGFAWYDLLMLTFLIIVTIITFVKPSPTHVSYNRSTTSVVPAISSAEKSRTAGALYRADIAAPPCNDTDLACYGASGQPNSQGHILTPVSGSNFFFVFTDPSLTLQQGTGIVQQMWGWMLGIVDAFVVLVLMLNGLKIILAGTVFRYANAVESLPGVLLSLIASHASMVFITAILALNNILAIGLYNTANSATWTDPKNTQAPLTLQTCASWYSGINSMFSDANAVGAVTNNTGGAATTILGWIGGQIACNGQQQYDRANANTTVNNTVQGIPQLTGLSAIFNSLTNLLSFLTGMLILVIVSQMILRIFFINLYAILAPLGIACWALPGKVGQPVTQQWFKGYISIVLAQFVQVAALIIAQVFSAAVITYMAKIPSLTDAMTHDTTLVLVIAITRLWFIIRIPGLFEAAPTRAMTEVGHSVVQAAGTAMAMQMAEAQFAISAVTSVIGMAGGGAAVLAA